MYYNIGILIPCAENTYCKCYNDSFIKQRGSIPQKMQTVSKIRLMYIGILLKGWLAVLDTRISNLFMPGDLETYPHLVVKPLKFYEYRKNPKRGMTEATIYKGHVLTSFYIPFR